MNSYLFVLSIIDIICVVCIVVVYEIRLGRIKELYHAYKDESWEAAGEIEYLNCLIEEEIWDNEEFISRFNAAYENVKDITANPIQLDGDLASIMEEAQKRG